MLDDAIMLVRLPGGDVVRRPVAYEHRIVDISGVERGVVREPELRDGEAISWALGDPIPRIIRTHE